MLKRFIACLLVVVMATPATAALTSYPNLTPAVRTMLQNTSLFVKGNADNNLYLLEVDPATGALPVTGTIVTTSASTGPTGAAVPAQATYGGMNVGGTLTGLVGTAAGLKVDGSAVTQPVSGTFWQATQPVSGTFWQATQPISAASLPLPTLAATSTKQPALGTAGTASADVITVQGIASMTALKVDGSAVTQPISVASLPLPALAATSTLQGTGNTSLASIDTKTPALGQAAMASSVPVALASNQSAIPVTESGTWTMQPGNTANTTAWLVTQAGRAKGILATYDYTGGTVTTAAYTQVTASTANAVTKLYIFDSSGSAIIIATGAGGAEVDQLYLPPGGNGAPYELTIAASTRISIKALDTSASTGRLIITGLQ